MRPNPPKTLVSVADFAVETAKKLGAKQCAAITGRRRSYKVVYRDGKWEEISGATRCSLTVRLFVDGRYAVHTTTDTKKKSVEKFIGDAVALTRHLMPDPHRHLPGAALYKGRSDADLGLYDPASTKLDLSARQKMAQQAFEAARSKAGDKLISASAGFGDSQGHSVQRHSDGFAGHESRTSVSLWATVSLKDPNGSRPSDWAVTAATHLGDLERAEAVGAEAARRAVTRLGAKKIGSIKLPLIIENRGVGRLLGGFMRPLHGGALYQGRSCFEKQLGKPVASKLLTLTDDPLLKKGLASRRFDSEGIAAKELSILQAGVLRNFYLGTYYAEKLKKKPTTGSQSNLVFAKGTKDLAGLCRDAGKALLITRFIGGNSNSTSGDFSHGLAGFLVEGGQIGQPVIELNIAGNHRKFWRDLVAVGADPYPYSAMRTPSLMLAPQLVAGK
jgi:PmbA protein